MDQSLQVAAFAGRAGEKFDASGRPTDEATRRFLVTFLEGFAGRIGHFRK